MNYVLACAMRGPDATGTEAEAWKCLVTQRLRWFAAMELGEVPTIWCLGNVTPPPDELDPTMVKRARDFSRDISSVHVVYHAVDAFGWLIRSGKASASMRAEMYYRKLCMENVL